VTGAPRHSHPRRDAAIFAAGATVFAAAAAALSPSGDFIRIFLYVAATLAVCACATAATIRVLGRVFKDAVGTVAFGALIGLFVVAPLALSGAFHLLEAVLGTL